MSFFRVSWQSGQVTGFLNFKNNSNSYYKIDKNANVCYNTTVNDQNQEELPIKLNGPPLLSLNRPDSSAFSRAAELARHDLVSVDAGRTAVRSEGVLGDDTNHDRANGGYQGFLQIHTEEQDPDTLSQQAFDRGDAIRALGEEGNASKMFNLKTTTIPMVSEPQDIIPPPSQYEGKPPFIGEQEIPGRHPDTQKRSNPFLGE